jgi:class 3 adenylate cyclase
MEIGVKLRLLREKHGLKQINLANALQVSSQAVSKWERGANLPDIGILLKIAALFNVSIDYLLGVTDAKNGVFEGTVFFTGITHFARRSVVTGSKDLAEYINVLFYHLTESVLKYDGIPVKYLGDGFLAFFSGPDHADRAIEAAMYAKKVIYQKELVVSLHAGEIYLGLIGHPHYAMRDIVGETVNVAFLMIGWIAKNCDSGIGATETVIRQANRTYNFKQHFHVEVDLMDEKYVDVYEIV